MSSPESGNQGNTAPTSNAGLPVSYGALISDPGPPYVYQWGNETGEGVALTFSFPGATAAWATVLTYSDSNEPETYSPLNAAEMAAARSALTAWSRVANISFTEVTETATDVGQIRFAWTQASNGSASAWAYFPDEYWASGGDVWLSTPNMGSSRDVDSEWQAGGGAYQTLLHEIGHALGLIHPFDGLVTLPPQENTHQYTLMAYETHPNSLFRHVIDNGDGSYSIEFVTILPDTPMLYDILAIQYLYGANQGYHAGFDVYSFDPATPFIRTLWDGGGTDTLSVSDFTIGCRIDLRPGTFSSITILSDPLPPGYFSDTVPTYDGTNNLAIAFDCWIENAIGGSGHDIITGNILDNGITGGLGLDTALYAGAKSGYTVTRVGAGYTVTDTNMADGDDGTDTLTGIEWLQFSDSLQRLGLPQRDFNGDGKSDILIRNDSTGVLFQYQMNGTTILGTAVVDSPGTAWKVVGNGDYNGDGKSDILIRNDSTGVLFQFQMNGTAIGGTGVVPNAGTAWKVVGNGDYNGDGKSDILIRNDSTGVLVQFRMDGTTIVGMGVVDSPGTDWKVVGNGDYNGDGKSDILMRNDSTGVIFQYQMNGMTYASTAVVDSPGTDWKVVGSGDYNGDGKSDILIRNDSTGVLFQFQMNGTTILGTAVVDSPGTAWKVVGNGDYNGDGKSDILMRNDSTGVIFQYQMNGMTYASTAVVDSPGTDWKVSNPDTYTPPLPGNKTISDYNGDGKSDILIRNDSTGVLFQFQMNGTAIGGTGVVPNAGTAWKVVGNGDYNGDGKSDILIRNDSTGVLVQFRMDGTTIVGMGVVDSPGTDWKVVGNGDYNGDGKSDILMRNDSTGVIFQYQMNGMTYASTAVVDSPGTDWKVVGSGDYNGDGKSDILIRNDSTGVLFQFQMNGTAIGGTGVVPNAGTIWKVVGNGDFNGDGKSDILIRNDSTGVLVQFQMNGTAIVGMGVVDSPGTAWKVAGTGDYNGDGKSDILMRNDSTGVIFQYQMNGMTYAGTAVVDSPGTDWGVVG